MLKLLSTSLALFTWFQGLAQESENYLIISDIPYYQGEDYDAANHKLNLVIPEHANNPPLLIWIGGGAWSYVDRQVEMELAKKIAKEGIAVASVGHRLSPATWKDPKLDTGIQHPEHILDISRAVKFLLESAEVYGYSESNFIIGGFSSGAHLAALLVMDPSYLEAQQIPVSLIKGAIPIAGTFDIPHYYQVMSAGHQALADNHIGGVFGLSSEAQLHASPTSYLQHLETPLLLIACANTRGYHQYFEDRLIDFGFNSYQAIYPDYGHSDLWRHLSNAQMSDYRDLMVEFIQHHSVSQTP